jgi:UDPglucose 6-dehydrogenase
MNITVLGLWHLGCVTAACSARHYQVTGLDFDEQVVTGLRQARAPLFEPGLNELLAAGLASRRLSFTVDPDEACAQADILWVTYDTPVDEQDESDTEAVLGNLRRALPHLRPGALVLISAQLPVGTCRALEVQFPQFHFAYSPENLRLGRALDAFEKADRVVVGVRADDQKPLLAELFKPFTSRVLFMRTESAEMVKHSLNAFLALSITFINEIARLCEPVGADAKEVSEGLKSEPRIGRKAYLGPGGPFAGGTLARDVVTLTKLGAAQGERLSVIPAIKESNDLHRGWAFRRLQTRLQDLRGRRVAMLGLTYTPNTDTLRRSAAVELCRALIQAGATVAAFDPAVKQLPPELAAVKLTSSLAEALADAEAAVVCTEWPEFRQARWPALLAGMRQPLIVDANRFLEAQLAPCSPIELLSVGRAASLTPPSA